MKKITVMFLSVLAALAVLFSVNFAVLAVEDAVGYTRPARYSKNVKTVSEISSVNTNEEIGLYEMTEEMGSLPNGEMSEAEEAASIVGIVITIIAIVVVVCLVAALAPSDGAKEDNIK